VVLQYPANIIWYVRSETRNGEDPAEGSAVAIRLQKPGEPKVAKTYLLTCGHVVRGTRAQERRIRAWPPNVGHNDAQSRRLKVHTDIKELHAGCLTEAERRNAADDWVILDFEEGQSLAGIEVVRDWTGDELSGNFRIWGYPDGVKSFPRGVVIPTQTVDTFHLRHVEQGMIITTGTGTRFGISGGGVFGAADMKFAGIHHARSDPALQAYAVSSSYIRERLFALGYEPSASPLGPTSILRQILAGLWRSTIACAAVLVAPLIRISAYQRVIVFILGLGLGLGLGLVFTGVIPGSGTKPLADVDVGVHRVDPAEPTGVQHGGGGAEPPQPGGRERGSGQPDQLAQSGGDARAGPGGANRSHCLGEGSEGPVKVGAIYPSSGTGIRARYAIELATEIINNDFGGLLLGGDGRFTCSGGSKIKVEFRDSDSDAVKGADAARDLIENEKVVALTGAYESTVTQIVSERAEGHVPFLNGESVADVLTERGFEWFFRTTPAATQIARRYLEFLKDVKAKQRAVNKIAIVHDKSQYGTVAAVVKNTFDAGGLHSSNVPYWHGGDMSEPGNTLKESKPDVVIFMGYIDDAVRFAKRMKEDNYKPWMMIADEAGFSEPEFIKKCGDIVQGVLTRSSWIVGKPGSVPYRVNEMYKQKLDDALRGNLATKDAAQIAAALHSGGLDSITARTMQGFMVLAGAINRAQSTEPAQIRDALRNTDLEPKQLIAHYDGVVFNDKGQNRKASMLLSQLQDSKYVPVWPEKEAKEAGAKLLLPYTGWAARANFGNGTNAPPTKSECH
jgi:branched-chain amino acid transport system substrate-binding protein